jgi:hypothetical protein
LGCFWRVGFWSEKGVKMSVMSYFVGCVWVLCFLKVRM